MNKPTIKQFSTLLEEIILAFDDNINNENAEMLCNRYCNDDMQEVRETLISHAKSYIRATNRE